VEVNEPLPALSGPELLGGEVTPADYEGKVLLVSVWATWCGPCRVEQPMLQRLWERYEDREVQFLGIDIRDYHDAAVTWVKDEFNVTYPSIEDPYGGLADDLGLIGVPASLLVDRGGTIRYRIDGLPREEDLVRILDELLAGS
jgi:thiol-disulfide isomerase/thioredoxin